MWNVLALSVRQGKIRAEGLATAIVEAEELMDRTAVPVSPTEVVRLALASGCTAYDCEFVSLAHSHGVPMVTSDRQVLKAFPSIAVSMEAFGA